jgi:4a-hydroxytetrahydrobiopterin dehydratase
MHSVPRRRSAIGPPAYRRAAERARALLKELEPGWTLTPTGHLRRNYEFRDFAGAMVFANRVGDIAEQQGHHPDLYVAWGSCGVEIWTHKIDGLTESDFFLAAKADRAFRL